jgi:hypothetical protein
METSLKKILKSVTLELRHLLEGQYDTAGAWQPGDLENRLASIGVRGDREPRPVDELNLSPDDLHARKIVDAYLKLREEAGVARQVAVTDFLRETAYTWANRLIALRCMESRELIDSVILQQEVYGGRSLEHHRLAQRQPELCSREDDGLFAVLDKVFREQTQRLPMLFDPQAPGIALRPSPAAIKDCFGLLSLHVETLRKCRIRIKEDESAEANAEPPNPFVAPDALGWTYQYWNTEEKDRVFEKVRTVKGAKIAGADIVPATQLYTEDYMVKFLVQNSLGATWMGMHPASRLCEGWEYYVRDADRAPVQHKPVRDITFLDPACGSGHFLIEAFDLYYAMYQEEGELTDPAEISTAILTQNLFGIDIDARAVQIAEAALWMKAAERAFDYSGAAMNLVAANASHLKGPAWEEFLAGFKKEPSVARVLRKFAQTMEKIDEIGSLARPTEDLRAIIKEEHVMWERQIRERKEANFLFPDMREEALSGQLAFEEITDEAFGHRLFNRAHFALDDFTVRARHSGEFDDQLLARETRTGFQLLDILGRRYDVVAANPPYMSQRNMSSFTKEYVTTCFPHGSQDLYTCFIERFASSDNEGTILAFVTSHTFLFIGTYEDLRKHLLHIGVFQPLCHYGSGVMEDLSNPNALGFCSWIFAITPSVKASSFLDLRDTSVTPETLHAAALRMHEIENTLFLRVPSARLSYWIPKGVIKLFEGQTIGDVSLLANRTKTGQNERFVRALWEIPSPISPQHDWLLYQKGGDYLTYSGNNSSIIRWSAGYVAHYRNDSSCRVTDAVYTCRTGITYNAQGQQLCARLVPPVSTYDVSGPMLFTKDDADLYYVLAVMNTPFASYIVKSLNATVNLQSSEVMAIPLPYVEDTLKKDISERSKHLVRLRQSLLSNDMTEYGFTGVLLSKETMTEVENTFCNARDALSELIESLYAVESPTENGFFRLPPETASEGRPGLSGRVARDYACWKLLNALGHTWHHASECLNGRVKGSSKIVVTLGNDDNRDKHSLVEELLPPFASWREEFDCEGEDNAIDAIEEWIRLRAFAYMIQRFDRRPVAWQIQSRSNTTPAFSCFVGYHHLDVDTLPKLRSQYVAPLRQRCETELRGIFSIATEARSDRQEKRRVELEDAIVELQRFDATLETVDTTGFGPDSLRPALRQYAINDAMLVLKCCWLRRLSDLVVKGPLGNWLQVASKTELHPSFSSWIANALSHLDHFCARVGPQPPDEEKLDDDPTAANLAVLIAAEAETMFTTSLRLACDVWWKPFHETVLQPFKDQVKELKEEQKQSEARLKADPEPEPSVVRELKARVKELKAEIKKLNAEIEKRTALAQGVRDLIEAWRTTEPATWGDWLADQPLFDQISSLDDRRSPPTTIAAFVAQESLYAPDINDGVRVNIAPLQKAGLLAADVLAAKDIPKAIADRAEWRSDERRWVREGKFPRPAWWNGEV